VSRRLIAPLLGLWCAAGVALAQEAGPVSELLSERAPLILKDGRVALVSVYAIPFPAGSAELQPASERALAAIVARHATDCFLTAQAIGHVRPGPDAEGDGLAAHRLARKRAETVQELLARYRLPGKTVASVWDWQFAVPASRVTLWVFELAPGEDCAGEAVALATGGAGPDAALEGVKAAARRGEAREDGGETPPVAAETSVPEPEDAVVRAPQGAEAPAPVARPVERAETVDREPDPPKTAAVTDEPERTAAPSTPAPASEARPRETALRAEPQQSLTLVFRINSSYLAHEDAKRLRSWLGGLPDSRYVVRIEAAVAEGGVRNARTPEEARRYNRWIAERRVKRVRELVEKLLGARLVRVEEDYREGDSSRRVVIQLREAPPSEEASAAG